MKPDVMIAVLVGLGVTIPAGHALLPSLAEFVGNTAFAGILGGAGTVLGLLGLQAYKKMSSQRPDGEP